MRAALLFPVVCGVVLWLPNRASRLGAEAPGRQPAAPPAVRVIAFYEGASAREVADTVTAPLEEQLRGTEGSTSIRSESRSGQAVITVYFKPGTNMQFATVLVQNRASLAVPVLPDAVKQRGVAIRLGDGNRPPVLWLTLASERHDLLYLSSFTELQLRPALERIPLVRGVQATGAGRPRLRVVLDPDRLAARGLDAADVAEALRMYESPKGDGDPALRLLGSVEDISNLLVKANGEGARIRLRDLAQVEIGAGPQTDLARRDGKRVVALSVDAEDEDAAAVRAAVLREMDRLRRRLPEEVTLEPAPDFTKTAAALLVEMRLPDSASLERVEQALAGAEKVVRAIDGVEGVLSIGDDTARGRLYVRVKDADTARPRIRKALAAEVRDAACRVLDPGLQRLPPDRRTAVSLIVEDELGLGPQELQKTADALQEALAKSPGLLDAWSEFRANTPELTIELDRDKLARVGITVRRALDVLAAARGVVDPRFDVRLGKDGATRLTPDRLKRLKVRTDSGEMVPLASLARIKEVSGPCQIHRYNGWPAAPVEADLFPGATVDEARKACRDAARKVPMGFRVLLSGTGMDKPEDLTPGK
jgi:multidrug efflux pump subunit AcrB